jgi:hypothetical protein
VVSELVISDDELDMGDNEGASSEVADIGTGAGRGLTHRITRQAAPDSRSAG